MALNLLRGANTVEDLNPARVKAREEVRNLLFKYLENASTWKK
jgi:hypothetical protein